MAKQPLAIHQFTPSLGYGDAISNNVIDLMQLLRKWGYSSEIFVEHSDPRVAQYCRRYTAYRHQSTNLLLYHYGTASPLTQFLLHWPQNLALVYHNITPHHFYEFEDAVIYKILKDARQDLNALSIAPWAIGDSNYNCCELRELGFKNVETIPYLLNFNTLNENSTKSAEQQVLQKLDDGYVNILFVGRLVPNKRQDDLVRLLAYYQQLITPKARLILIGSASPNYKTSIEILAEQLGVQQDVHLIGHLPLEAGFTGYFKGASVFVSMSEHEGFGVPLLESMYFGLPVIAYAAGAVPETMGDAGILVTQKRYDVVAELINLLVTDTTLREQIVQKQFERLIYFDRARQEKRIKNWLAKITLS